MTQIARLAGAIIVTTEGDGAVGHFLVGDTKVPCDWKKAGFARPKERDATKEPYVRLEPTGPITVSRPFLRISLQGEKAAQLMAARLLVARNGSVSERLWRLVTGDDEETGTEAPEWTEARWLEEMPPAVWEVVRNAVLRCT